MIASSSISRPTASRARPLATTIALAWTAASFAAVKGIVHAPCAKPAMRPESRDALLTAIAKARGWIDDIRLGRIASFAEIAEREAQGGGPGEELSHGAAVGATRVRVAGRRQRIRSADGEQSRIFALRTRIGLQREGVIAGDLAKLVR
jgi:hypothetical protein